MQKSIFKEDTMEDISVVCGMTSKERFEIACKRCEELGLEADGYPVRPLWAVSHYPSRVFRVLHCGSKIRFDPYEYDEHTKQLYSEVEEEYFIDENEKKWSDEDLLNVYETKEEAEELAEEWNEEGEREGWDEE